MWVQWALILLAGVAIGTGAAWELAMRRVRSVPTITPPPAAAAPELEAQAEAEPIVAAPTQPDAQPIAQDGPESPLPEEVSELIEALPGMTILVDQAGTVTYASEAATAIRLVRLGRVAFAPIAECAEETLEQGSAQESEVSIKRPPLRAGSLDLRVRGIPLPNKFVLLLLDDLTDEYRVAAVRRDFIANVSHELKTPVGAVSLLSEAIVAARDDPEAVEHFAKRMQTEVTRLTALINDVIDLSRVQGDDPMAHGETVEVDELIHGAADFVRAQAEAKDIEIVMGGRSGCQVFGDSAQLLTALRNVLGNAIVYSEPHTRVAIAVREADRLVEIDVKDQGIGIPEKELDRIFERFYRVDSARSRSTGGTGLGLAIVRNVCRNHGGDVLVWSVANEGSTFTLQLPSGDPSNDDDGRGSTAQPMQPQPTEERV